MRAQRVRFFRQRGQTDTGTQTDTLYEMSLGEVNVEDSMHEIAKENVLLQNFPIDTDVDRALVGGFSSRLTFFEGYLSDPNFDQLVPDFGLLEKYRPSLTIDITDKSFKISTFEENHQWTFQLQDQYIPLLQSLENREINQELYLLLTKADLIHWDNGSILALVRDYRGESTQKHVVWLKAAPEVYMTNIHGLDEECEIITKMNPTVCTDPSPDVARVFSVLDRRKKMWIGNNDRRLQTPFVNNKRRTANTEHLSIRTAPLDKNMEIPKSFIETLQNYQSKSDP